MPLDLSMELIQATVQLEQPLGDGTRTVGTGFLISDPGPDGKPHVVLVTANHVLKRMPGPEATIGYRVQTADGTWRYAPQTITIRAGGKELWTHHSTRDVAAITITAPAEFAKAAIPLNWLAGDETFGKYQLGPGDEMMALGFPQGLSANPAGFPILRSGRVASYPLTPSTAFPTFLLDFSVFPGNSGGPVYMAEGNRRRAGVGGGEDAQFIAGMLTQQVELGSQNLEIGIVTHAKFIRETVAMLDGAPLPPPEQMAKAATPAPPTATAVAADTAAVSR
jgi:hypothetical protein